MPDGTTPDYLAKVLDLTYKAIEKPKTDVRMNPDDPDVITIDPEEDLPDGSI